MYLLLIWLLMHSSFQRVYQIQLNVTFPKKRVFNMFYLIYNNIFYDLEKTRIIVKKLYFLESVMLKKLFSNHIIFKRI